MIASSSVSTVPDSLRGLGIGVTYTHRTFRFHGADDAFEFHAVHELLADDHFATIKTQ